jgi:flagellar assembly protein FliH
MKNEVASAVLKSTDAEKLAVTFSPRTFPFRFTGAAVDFVKIQNEKSSDFKLDRLVAEQTGIHELEKLSIEERVEKEALGRLLEIKEQAFDQAFQLGMEEGRKTAFNDTMQILEQQAGSLDLLISNISKLKNDLVLQNESHIVRLAFYMAKRLALTEIKENPESVLTVVRDAMAEVQNEEKFVLYLSQFDHEYIKSRIDSLGPEFESLKTAKIEVAPEVQSGGCKIETNYGEIDATIEQRVEKLWLSISSKIPKTTDIITAQGSD